MTGYCKGIYCGCAATGSQSPCAPCERIKRGTSTIEKEMQRKRRGEVAETRKRLTESSRVAYCVFCKRSHAGGATCMGHHP